MHRDPAATRIRTADHDDRAPEALATRTHQMTTVKAMAGATALAAATR
jgi:hypothetical protein